MSFNEKGYEIVRNVLNEQTTKLLSIQFEMVRNTFAFINNKHPNDFYTDSQITEGFSSYAPQCFESLLILLNDKMNEVTQKQLAPSYSYARFYYYGATLERHMDRPSCEYSATVCIQDDETHKWPISITGLDGVDSNVILNPGDMMIYRGDLCEHWRDPFTGSCHIQAFLHYVDKNGKYTDHIYDKRPMLGFGPMMGFQSQITEEEYTKLTQSQNFTM